MEMPSSSSSSSSNYDVFLSFRGVDTRKSFTDHLYVALKREGIHTFRDNIELETGRSIGPEVRKAIEGSKISIVVFSINYAGSRWCLDELAHIMKCRKELGQWVLPIFYNVQPTVVRHQSESFKDAFTAHKLRFKKDIGRWRAVLREAADLAGVDVQNHGDGYESTIINDIVKDICDKLNRKRLCVPTNLIGLDARVDQVKSLLVIDNLDEIRIVGICGMGGIGKTTTAKQVYNLIFQNFEGCCFLTNIPEKPDSNDMVRFQNEFLSQIIKGKHEDIYNVHRGFEMIQERLGDKRILIVVDDVSEIEQLKYILGNYTWLSCGSRIIITTRTLDLEKPTRGYHQYLVEVLDEGESLQLFSLHCFEECHPPKEYMKLAKSVICYAGGIPLALEVLGSNLSGQSANEWKRGLEKLKAIPARRIQDVLKTSYDCLDDMEKSLFLDVACFFVDLKKCDKDYVISILDNPPHFFAEDGINTLIKRCLVKVTSSNELVMHDLLLEMGREIVRRECPADPGKCSRVWRDDVAFNLLKDETGTEAIEVFSFQPNLSSTLVDFSDRLSVISYIHREAMANLLSTLMDIPDRLSVSSHCFREMKGLRLLRVDHLRNSVEFTGSDEHIFLSKQLRLVQWQFFPLESIPTNLHLGNLVDLVMPFSGLKVWGGMKLPKLKFLDLHHSSKLTETPNFEGLPNLVIINLQFCENLLKVHESISGLTKLVDLYVSCCARLSLLPELPSSLTTLDAAKCPRLERINLTNYHFIACVSNYISWADRHNRQIKFDGVLKKEPIGVGGGKKILIITENGLELGSFLQPSDYWFEYLSVRSIPISSIFVRGSEVSRWYTHQSMSNSICFNVPPLHGCQFIGVVICVVYAQYKSSETRVICPRIELVVANKITRYVYEPEVRLCFNEAQEDTTWVTTWMFRSHDYHWWWCEEGDRVEVTVTGTGKALQCGVRLVLEPYDSGFETNMPLSVMIQKDVIAGTMQERFTKFCRNFGKMEVSKF